MAVVEFLMLSETFASFLLIEQKMINCVLILGNLSSPLKFISHEALH